MRRSRMIPWIHLPPPFPPSPVLRSDLEAILVFYVKGYDSGTPLVRKRAHPVALPSRSLQVPLHGNRR